MGRRHACRSAAPACHAISTCAASSSQRTASDKHSDGYGDFQGRPDRLNIVEVYKAGNALQFGANSLGGAINL